MSIKLKAAAIALAVFSATGASAQTVGEKSINIGASIFGGSLSGSYRLAPQFGVRGMLMGGFGYKNTITRSNVDYALDGKLGAVAVMGDYFPMQGNWRVSGGILRSNAGIDMTATLSASNPYAGFTTGNVKSNLKFNRTYIPMVTTGYDWNFHKQWVLSGEAGAMFTNGGVLTTTGSSAAIQAQLDADADIAKWKSDAAKLKLFPFIGISVGYRF